MELTPFEKSRLFAITFTRRFEVFAKFQQMIALQEVACEEHEKSLLRDDDITTDILAEEIENIDRQIITIADTLEEIGISA